MPYPSSLNVQNWSYLSDNRDKCIQQDSPQSSTSPQQQQHQLRDPRAYSRTNLLSALPNLVKSYLNINVSQLGGKKPQNLKLYVDSSWEKHLEKQKIKLYAFQNKHIWFILVHRSHDKIGESVPPAVFHMVPLRDGPQRISGGCSESHPWPCFLAS